MTCIVGFLDKENDRVIMGADSASVAGSLIVSRKDTKLFKNGDFIIGCTTSFRMIQLLRFSFKPPVINDKDIYEYMCTDFVNEVRKCFTDGGFMQKQTEGDERGGTFLVAYKNRLFQIDQDFQVGENLDGFISVGCGCDYALGAMNSMNEDDISADIKVLKALEAAEHFSTGVSKPFIFETTKHIEDINNNKKLSIDDRLYLIWFFKKEKIGPRYPSSRYDELVSKYPEEVSKIETYCYNSRTHGK